MQLTIPEEHNKNSYCTTNHLPVKKQDQGSKKEDVDASYEAWKEKKTEILRAQAKEKNEKKRKEQKVTEEKQEKSQCAKQVKSLFTVNSPGSCGTLRLMLMSISVMTERCLRSGGRNEVTC